MHIRGRARAYRNSYAHTYGGGRIRSQAREYFEAARSAQRHIGALIASIGAMREREGLRAQGYEAIGRSTGHGDPMGATDARIDAEAEAYADLEQCERIVGEALEVCRGVRLANPSHPQWGDVLRLRYIDMLDWDSAGRALGITASAALSALISGVRDEMGASAHGDG